MRLIDADELISNLKKDPLFELVEQYGISGVIEAQPTVHAVPTEWIKMRIKWLRFQRSKTQEEDVDYVQIWNLGEEINSLEMIVNFWEGINETD